MKTLKYSIFLIIISIFLIQCTTSKGMAKKAEKLEESGNIELAADYYYRAVVIKNSNVDALGGLKRTGQQTLQKKLQKFNQYYSQNDLKNAVYSYTDAKNYFDKIGALKVDLNIPPFTTEDFEKAKDKYLANLYEEANEELDGENFKKAEILLTEINKFDKDYKDVNSLKNFSKVEPLYRAALEAFQKEKYRVAYDYCIKIEKIESNFKDVEYIKSDALELGVQTVTISAEGRYADIANSIKEYSSSSLTNLNDPFIKLVARDNLNQILQEQQLSISGIVDQNTATKAGNLLGVKYMVVTSVLDYNVSRRPMTYKSYSGFESYSVKYKDKEGKTRYRTMYKPITYRVYNGKNEATISTKYKLIDLATGEILMNEVINKTETSYIKYISYKGNSKNLRYSLNGGANNSSSSKNEIRRLSGANRTLISVDQLTKKAINSIAGKSSTKIQTVLKQQ
jgi:hypothetical protein